MIVLQAQVSTKGIKTINKYGGIDKAAKKFQVDLRLVVVCDLDCLHYMKLIVVVSDKIFCCTAFLDNSSIRKSKEGRYRSFLPDICLACMLLHEIQ